MNAPIVSVTAHTVGFRLTDPLATSLHAYDTLNCVIVEIEAKDGARGYGEARDSTHITGETQAGIIAAINDFLAPAIIGVEPSDTDDIHRRMNTEIVANTAAKSAIDIAIYDLAGRQAGMPVSSLLGGAPRGPVASSKAVSVGPAAAMVTQARGYVDAGFRTLKIKTGVDAAAELAAIAAIRGEVGPEISLKLDANQGWTLPEASRFLAAAEPHDILMIEQPLADWDIAGAAELRRRTSIPVMLDEGVHSAHDALRAIEAGAVDYINIKLLKTGGLKPALDVAAVCAAAGVTCQIGTLDTSIGSAAAVHLVHATSVLQFAEINGPTRLERDLATGFRVSDGYAVLDEGAGLGIDVHSDALTGVTS